MKSDDVSGLPLGEPLFERIAKGTVLTGLMRILATLVSLASLIVITRFLSPNEYGLLAISWVIAYIVGYGADFGLNTALVKFVAEDMAKHDKKAIVECITTSFKVKIGTGLLVGLILYYCAGLIAIRIFHEPHLTLFIQTAAYWIIFGNALTLVAPAFQGLEKFEFMTAFSVLPSILWLLFCSIALVTGYGALGAAFAFVYANIIAGITGILCLFRTLGAHVSFRHFFCFPRFRNLLSFGLYPMVDALLSTLYLQINILLLGVYWSSSEAGLLKIAIGTAGYVGISSTLLSVPLYPIMSELYSLGDRRRLSNLFVISTKYVAISSLPIAIIMIVLANPIIFILYTEKYLTASAGLQILALAYAIGAIGWTGIGNLAYAIERPEIRARSAAIASAPNIVLCVLFIPQLGLVGAALSLLSYAIVGSALNYYWVYRVSNISLPLGVIVRPSIASLFLGALLFGLYELLGGHLLSLLVTISIGILVYFGIVFRLGLINRAELDLLRPVLGVKLTKFLSLLTPREQ